MIKKEFLDDISAQIKEWKESGLYKEERYISSPQAMEIELSDGKKLLNFCSNNYLGLANDKLLIDEAKKSLDKYGFGAASVRFICGTMDAHLEFEKEMANFLGYEDCISFVSCWSANNGVFSALLDENDAIVSADLNHASIIDGIRLCKAKRFFYKYDDLNDLERALKEAKAVAKNIMIVSDGVFSMDGDIANIHGLGELSEKYEALLMIDDSHATGFIGENGRGSAEYRKAEGKIDILSSTLGKALGGSGGGFICSKREIVEKLRNKARPYLFSNNITPMVARVSLKVLDIIKNSKELIKKSFDNTKYFRQRMVDAGFDVWLGVEGIHPIVPIMLGDAKLADDFSKQMLENGVYVVGLSYPVVPKDKARIRVQISSAHSKEHIDKCVNAFVKVGKMLKVV